MPNLMGQDGFMNVNSIQEAHDVPIKLRYPVLQLADRLLDPNAVCDDDATLVEGEVA